MDGWICGLLGKAFPIIQPSKNPAIPCKGTLNL
jgi:hypothetical protein